jgi:hypothetical protein
MRVILNNKGIERDQAAYLVHFLNKKQRAFYKKIL